ncbi:MAG: hypothetical protein M1827_002714 [Pycnora praestabilis]|nr:MAG: hypothetical protein M1827_002714 [Pycnora praestabilis]
MTTANNYWVFPKDNSTGEAAKPSSTLQFHANNYILLNWTTTFKEPYLQLYCESNPDQPLLNSTVAGADGYYAYLFPTSISTTDLCNFRISHLTTAIFSVYFNVLGETSNPTTYGGKVASAISTGSLTSSTSATTSVTTSATTSSSPSSTTASPTSSTSATGTSSSPSSNSSTGLSAGAIVGIVVGVLILIAACVCAYFVIRRRHRKADEQRQAAIAAFGNAGIPMYGKPELASTEVQPQGKPLFEASANRESPAELEGMGLLNEVEGDNARRG